MKTETTLEEREFALAYAIERCLDVKFDSSELRDVRQACRSALELNTRLVLTHAIAGYKYV